VVAESTQGFIVGSEHLIIVAQWAKHTSSFKDNPLVQAGTSQVIIMLLLQYSQLQEITSVCGILQDAAVLS
jgi:hypothetical protein